MITIHTVRFNVKPTHVEAFENAVNQISTALRQSPPEGIRYTICKAEDGTTFLGVLQLRAGQQNPLQDLPEGRTFRAGLEHWLASPPERLQWSQVVAFNSWDAAEQAQPLAR